MNGGYSESAFGRESVERVGWLVGPDRVLVTALHGPIRAPVPGTAGVLACDCVARQVRVITDDGAVARLDTFQRDARWNENQTPLIELRHEAPRRSSMLQFLKGREPEAAPPALLVGGFAKRWRSMEGVSLVAWGVDRDRMLHWRDIEGGGSSSIPQPIPGETAIVGCDIWAGPSVLVADGRLLRWSQRGWAGAGSVLGSFQDAEAERARLAAAEKARAEAEAAAR